MARPLVPFIYLESCLFLFPGIFQVMFSIIALEFFKLEPEQNGYLMSFFGIVQMVNCAGVQLTRARVSGSYQHNPALVQVVQGGVVGRMTASFSESSLLLLSVGVSALVGLGQVRARAPVHILTNKEKPP